MPIFPNWSSEQYLDAPTFNTAFGAVSGSFAQTASGLSKPGLVRPDAVSYAPSGLTLSVSAPSPFQVLFGSGILAAAHGTTTGQDTQAYSVPFSGVVPGTGSVTAYLVASYQQIQQNSYTVVGPPVGHPDYNPNFVPYTAYAFLVDSIALSATTTAPDNVTNIELGRFTLAAGATGLSTINTNFQQRASGLLTTHVATISGTTTLAITQAGQRIQVNGPSTITLPAVSGADGAIFPFSSTTTGAVTINAAGSDLIYGLFANPASGVTQVTLPQGAAVTLEADFGIWQIVGGSAQGIGVTAASGYVQQSGAVTNNNIAFWAGNLLIKDSGIKPTNASDSFLASSPGGVTSGHFAFFGDTNGSLADAGVTRSNTGRSVVAMVSGTPVSGHIAVFSDSGGTVTDGGAPVTAAALTVGFRQLAIVTNGAAQIAVTAAQAVMANSSFSPISATGVSVAINTGVNGANGLDTGALANNTWYYVYLISNGSAVAGLISLSATTPTLPGGYTYFGRMGAVKTNSSGNLLGTTQYNNIARYTTTTMLISSGFATPVNITVAGNQVPPTATSIAVQLAIPSLDEQAAEIGITSGVTGLVFSTTTLNQSTYALTTTIFDMMLIGTQVYWNNEFAGTSLYCYGWTDNVP